jgi:hypothetical protein
MPPGLPPVPASSSGGVRISGCRLPSPACAMVAMVTPCAWRSPRSTRASPAPRPGHADVLGQHRAEPFHRRVGQPARGEQRLRLELVGGLLRPLRTRVEEHLGQRVRLGLARLSRRVDLREQQGLRCRRQAQVLPLLRPLAGRRDPAIPTPSGSRPLRVVAATASPAATMLSKAPTTVRGAAARAGRSRSVTSVTTPQRPLRPDEQADQVVAGHALGGAVTEADRRTVGACGSAHDGLEARAHSRG